MNRIVCSVWPMQNNAREKRKEKLIANSVVHFELFCCFPYVPYKHVKTSIYWMNANNKKNVLRNMQPEEDTHADWPDSNRNHKSKSLHSPNFCAVRFAALCDAVFTNLYGCLGVRQSVPPKKSSYILRTWKKCEVKAMEKSRIAKLTHDTHNFKPSQVSDSSVNAWICIAFIFFASFVATVCYSYARSHKANMLYIFIYKLQYQ